MSQNRIAVIIPQLGLSMQEAAISQWHKQDGDLVRKGETLLEIDAEKATYEIEAPADGRFTSLGAKVGDVIPVTEIIGWIEPESP